MSAPNEITRALAEEGGKVRGYIASNRSETLLRIFDYLLQQSIEGRRPKETEIAREVFRDELTTPGQQGSRVRVGVYRLRKKLDAFYGTSTGRRLVIPPGEYALQIEIPETPAVGVEPAAERPGRRWPLVWMAIGALLVLNGLAAMLYVNRDLRPGGALARSPLWSVIARNEAPSVLVMGDQFAFEVRQKGESNGELVHDFRINSSDDLYRFASTNPALRNTLSNRNLYTTSASVVSSVDHILAYLRPGRIQPTTSFMLDPDMMQSSNIVYVGTLDEMSYLLRTPLFEAWGFQCGPHCYDIIDKPSGRHFLSDSPYVLDDRIVPRRDYGYIASFPGPAGHQVIIVSGTGDAAVRQMVRVVIDPKTVEQIHRRIGCGLTSFEALYQVRTMFDQTYGSTLLVARTLNSDHMWDKTRPDD